VVFLSEGKVAAKLDVSELGRKFTPFPYFLVLDVGELGLHGRVSSGSVYVAPPVRVWLDMLGEPRGEDAAALFREAVIGW
jgi:hypothetical protein